MKDFRDFDDQFRETTDERNERLREKRHARIIESLRALVADLSDTLTDEGAAWTVEGLDAMRRRVANALPLDTCPDWLRQYRTPPLLGS